MERETLQQKAQRALHVRKTRSTTHEIRLGFKSKMCLHRTRDLAPTLLSKDGFKKLSLSSEQAKAIERSHREVKVQLILQKLPKGVAK